MTASGADRIEKLARTLSVEDLELAASKLLTHYGCKRNPTDPGWAIKLLAEALIETFAEMFEAAAKEAGIEIRQN